MELCLTVSLGQCIEAAAPAFSRSRSTARELSSPRGKVVAALKFAPSVRNHGHRGDADQFARRLLGDADHQAWRDAINICSASEAIAIAKAIRSGPGSVCSLVRESDARGSGRPTDNVRSVSRG